MEQVDNWKLQYYFREGNKVADCGSNWSLKCNDITWITNFQLLPKEVKGEMNVDRMQLASF